LSGDVVNRLPVLYLSCETKALAGSKAQSRLRRLVPQDLVVNNVAFITSEKGGTQPEIFHQCGKGFLTKRLQSDMRGRGYDVAVSGSRERQKLAICCLYKNGVFAEPTNDANSFNHLVQSRIRSTS